MLCLINLKRAIQIIFTCQPDLPLRQTNHDMTFPNPRIRFRSSALPAFYLKYIAAVLFLLSMLYNAGAQVNTSQFDPNNRSYKRQLKNLTKWESSDKGPYVKGTWYPEAWQKE